LLLGFSGPSRASGRPPSSRWVSATTYDERSGQESAQVPPR
jgi:hypothetical protein